MRVARKVLPVLMSVVLVVSLCPGPAFANSNNERDVNAINLNEPKQVIDGDMPLTAMASAMVSLAFGKMYTGCAWDSDFRPSGVDPAPVYKLVLPKCAVVHLKSRSDDWLKWELYDSDGVSLIVSVSENFNNVLNTAAIDCDWHLNAGTYYLKPIKYMSGGSNYSFSVTASYPNISFQEAQGGSDNSLPSANSIVLGKTYTGQLARGKYTNPKSSFDVDFYKVSISKEMQLGVTATSDMQNLKCTLYDAKGNKIKSVNEYKDNVTGKTNLNMSVGVSASAVYIAIESASNYGEGLSSDSDKAKSNGLYTFTVKDLSQIKPSTNTPSSNATQSVQMHRLYNPNSGEHFYTASEVERDHLKNVGWDYEGIGWTAPKSSSTPVYRLYNANAGDHHYTTSAVERDHLVSVGWSDEGTGWYSDDSKRVALYRQYNPNAIAGSHNYTTSGVERDHLVGVGWNDEGIGWYGIS